MLHALTMIHKILGVPANRMTQETAQGLTADISKFLKGTKKALSVSALAKKLSASCASPEDIASLTTLLKKQYGELTCGELKQAKRQDRWVQLIGTTYQEFKAKPGVFIREVGSTSDTMRATPPPPHSDSETFAKKLFGSTDFTVGGLADPAYQKYVDIRCKEKPKKTEAGKAYQSFVVAYYIGAHEATHSGTIQSELQIKDRDMGDLPVAYRRLDAALNTLQQIGRLEGDQENAIMELTGKSQVELSSTIFSSDTNLKKLTTELHSQRYCTSFLKLLAKRFVQTDTAIHLKKVPAETTIDFLSALHKALGPVQFHTLFNVRQHKTIQLIDTVSNVLQQQVLNGYSNEIPSISHEQLRNLQPRFVALFNDTHIDDYTQLNDIRDFRDLQEDALTLPQRVKLQAQATFEALIDLDYLLAAAYRGVKHTVKTTLPNRLQTTVTAFEVQEQRNDALLARLTHRELHRVVDADVNTLTYANAYRRDSLRTFISAEAWTNGLPAFVDPTELEQEGTSPQAEVIIETKLASKGLDAYLTAAEQSVQRRDKDRASMELLVRLSDKFSDMAFTLATGLRKSDITELDRQFAATHRQKTEESHEQFKEGLKPEVRRDTLFRQEEDDQMLNTLWATPVDRKRLTKTTGPQVAQMLHDHHGSDFHAATTSATHEFTSDGDTPTGTISEQKQASHDATVQALFEARTKQAAAEQELSLIKSLLLNKVAKLEERADRHSVSRKRADDRMRAHSVAVKEQAVAHRELEQRVDSLEKELRRLDKEVNTKMKKALSFLIDHDDQGMEGLEIFRDAVLGSEHNDMLVKMQKQMDALLETQELQEDQITALRDFKDKLTQDIDLAEIDATLEAISRTDDGQTLTIDSLTSLAQMKSAFGSLPLNYGNGYHSHYGIMQTLIKEHYLDTVNVLASLIECELIGNMAAISGNVARDEDPRMSRATAVLDFLPTEGLFPGSGVAVGVVKAGITKALQYHCDNQRELSDMAKLAHSNSTVSARLLARQCALSLMSNPETIQNFAVSVMKEYARPQTVRRGELATPPTSADEITSFKERLSSGARIALKIRKNFPGECMGMLDAFKEGPHTYPEHLVKPTDFRHRSAGMSTLKAMPLVCRAVKTSPNLPKGVDRLNAAHYSKRISSEFYVKLDTAGINKDLANRMLGIIKLAEQRSGRLSPLRQILFTDANSFQLNFKWAVIELSRGYIGTYGINEGAAAELFKEPQDGRFQTDLHNIYLTALAYLRDQTITDNGHTTVSSLGLGTPTAVLGFACTQIQQHEATLTS